MKPTTVAVLGSISRPKYQQAADAAAQQAIATNELPRSSTPCAIATGGASTKSTCAIPKPRNTRDNSHSLSEFDSVGLGVASARVATKANAAARALQAATTVGPSKAFATP